MKNVGRRQSRLVLPVVLTGCEYNPQCQYVLCSHECVRALETHKCASVARVAILTGLGKNTRGMRKGEGR